MREREREGETDRSTKTSGDGREWQTTLPESGHVDLRCRRWGPKPPNVFVGGRSADRGVVIGPGTSELFWFLDKIDVDRRSRRTEQKRNSRTGFRSSGRRSCSTTCGVYNGQSSSEGGGKAQCTQNTVQCSAVRPLQVLLYAPPFLVPTCLFSFLQSSSRGFFLIAPAPSLSLWPIPRTATACRPIFRARTIARDPSRVLPYISS